MRKLDSTSISQGPGVYLFKDKAGKILYVGKAKSLKSRLRSYFDKKAGIKTKVLVERADRVETRFASNEVEALLLESNLIKEHCPPFNVVLRDDKNYLYIKVPINDSFPQIVLVRRVLRDGAKYFGPFVDAKAIRGTLRLIHRIFPLCTGTSKKSGRACLNYHLGVCPGVCLGEADSKDYHKTINEVVSFLGGDYAGVLKNLRQKMQSYSGKKQFEQAARTRDAILAVERISDRQQAVSPNLKLNQDVIGLARELNKTVVTLLQVRSGKLLNQQFFVVDPPSPRRAGAAERAGSQYKVENPEVLASFLRDHYGSVSQMPKEILLPEAVPDLGIFEKWLGGISGKKVDIVVPQRGRNRRLVKLATSSAWVRFGELAQRWDLENKIISEGLAKLKKVLKLQMLERIEAYDISDIQGTDSVGAMVVFENGKMDKKQYRRFKIRSVFGPNDFASLAEILRRRFAHEKGDEKFARWPDLILIDGGKGQVSTVKKAVGSEIKIVGMAKGSRGAPKAKDDLVIDGRVVVLPNNDPAKMLLQRVRDEAHRFALGYHTNLRRKTLTSKLESIPGIGAVTRKKLLKVFGSMVVVRRASEREIAEVVGSKLAKRISAYL